MKIENIITYQQLLDTFVIHCVARNLADETISSYKGKNKYFTQFLQDNDYSLKDIDEMVVEEYVAHLKTTTNANDISINTYLRATKAVLYYGMRLGVVGEFKVHLIKTTKKCKPTYSDADLEALVKPDGYKNLTELKVWAFECFLLSTGVRLGTAINIKMKDIDWDRRVITLEHTKNRKEQVLPITNSTIEVLKKYLDIRGWQFSEYLFSNNSGGQLYRRVIEEQVSSYNKKRGVPITSVHAFRHTYAKLSVLNGIDVFRLQKLMGHSTLSVTKEYVDLYGEDLRTEWCPLDVVGN